MSDLKRQMREDKALRDAARALIEADVAHVRSAFGGRSLSERVTERVSDSASEVFDKAASAADSNRGILAAIVGALVLWLARNPIMALFDDLTAADAGADVDADPGQPDLETPQSQTEEQTSRSA